MLKTKAFKLDGALINCDISAGLFVEVVDEDFVELVMSSKTRGEVFSVADLKASNQFIKLASHSLYKANTDRFQNPTEVTNAYDYMSLVGLGFEILEAMFEIKKKEEQQQVLTQMLG